MKPCLCTFADPSIHLGELNKVSAERWQALSQDEREVFNNRACEEASSCTNVELKQLLSQLAKLVCYVTYTYVYYTSLVCI